MFFNRKDKAAQPEPQQDTMPAQARKTLQDILEWPCELKRPPRALAAKFHRERIAAPTREEAAISTELSHLYSDIRILAAELDPVPPSADFRPALREQSLDALRGRRPINTEER